VDGTGPANPPADDVKGFDEALVDDGTGKDERLGNLGVEIEAEEGVGDKAVLLREVDKVDEAVVVATSRSTFQPTTAIAPTVDFERNVVVTIVQSSEPPSGVDTYVRTIPDGTFDKQFPSISPGTPASRKYPGGQHIAIMLD